jgi:hypothetical protein
MAKFRLNRRTVLRGAGSIAIALPWLEIMEPERPASAQAAAAAKRFLHVYTPGGAVIQPTNKWSPTGPETAPVLSPILSPLEPIKNKILIVDGMSMKSAVGEQHQSGIIALLTGTTQNNPPANGGLPGMNSYSHGPSIDQVLATQISKGMSKGSIEMSIRWATGKSHGLLSPINSLNFEDNATFAPIPPRIDPQAIFSDIFGTLGASQGGDAAALVARKKSILDFIDKKYAALSPRLGMLDRQKIDEHLTKIRGLEAGLTAPTNMGMACHKPTDVDTTGYNPTSGLMSADDGSIKDVKTDQLIPTVGKFMMDMMVMALACEITAVGTLQWTDTEAKHTFPWLNLPQYAAMTGAANSDQHHHYYQHDGGFKPLECEKIYTWYSQMHLYLLQAMDAVDMGGHTLLDESVVFFGSELADPPSHQKNGMPFFLAGKGGGLRPGRWIKAPGVSHNNLLVSILNLFGNNKTTFGEAAYCTGALAGLT